MGLQLVLVVKCGKFVYCHMKIKAKNGIEKKLDDAWSKLVKLRAGNKCEYCGTKTKQLHSHHLFTRSRRSTRWDVQNGICLCAGHHVLGNFSAHKSPLEFTEWLYTYKGKDFIDKIRLKSNGLGKFTLFEKEILLKELQKEINKYAESKS